MTALTYDTGMLVAAERGDRRAWALHRRALERGVLPTVATIVVVEAWRGSANLGRLLQGCHVEALTPPHARAAGVLLGRCSVTVGAPDAVVVEGALRRGDTVVTGDRKHLDALAAGVDRGLAIIAL